MGALAANRQVLAVTQATIAAQIHQTLDVHRNFTAQVALDGEVGVDVLANGQHFGVRKLIHATRTVDVQGFADLLSKERTDTGDVGERDRNPFRGRDIDASNTCHACLPSKCCGSVAPEPFFTTARQQSHPARRPAHKWESHGRFPCGTPWLRGFLIDRQGFDGQIQPLSRTFAMAAATVSTSARPSTERSLPLA